MRRRTTVVALAAVLIAAPAFAEKFWDSKDFTAWTDKECLELLRKSPWGYSYSQGRRQSLMLNSSTGVENNTVRNQTGAVQPTWGEGESIDIFEFQIVSAKPVRMALARLMMLKKPEDQALKEQTTKFVNMASEKQVVIQLSYRSIPPGSQFVSDVHSYFLTATLADFRTNTYLATSKNKNIGIVEYLAPNTNRSNPSFAFPRFDEKGDPYFTETEKSLTLRAEFAPLLRGKKQTYNIFVKMSPKEMRFGNEFAF
jgi:hypothetical protein